MLQSNRAKIKLAKQINNIIVTFYIPFVFVAFLRRASSIIVFKFSGVNAKNLDILYKKMKLIKKSNVFSGEIENKILTRGFIYVFMWLFGL